MTNQPEKSAIKSRIKDAAYAMVAAVKTVLSPAIDLSAASSTTTIIFIADRNYIVKRIIAHYVDEASSADAGVNSSVGHKVGATADIDEFCLYTSEVSQAEGTEKEQTLLASALDKGDLLTVSGPATQKTGTGVLRYVIELLPKCDVVD